MTHVLWTDVAPRDGLQNIATVVPTEAKVDLIRGLLAAGTPRVEATAFVSPRWVPQLADAAAVLDALGSDHVNRLRVLIPNLRGLELALHHGVRNVLVTIGATDTFNRRNVNRSVDESLAELRSIVELAQRNDCSVDVALSVSFGCPFEGAVAVERVVELCTRIDESGASEIGVADTIGVATPHAITEMFAAVSGVVPRERISLHVHDTRGLGVANVIAAYESGVSRFDGSAGGVGGCPFAPRSTGNVCSEDALQALVSLGATVDADLAALCRISETLEGVLGQPLPGKLYRAGVWDGQAIAQSQEANVG
ncbi:MAG TPA: hydroxymethylglutaryl-CoA lyase [Candidatus Dormibacteraeota bacterium]|nr:hydroxymethylglutaryl-CoA lyase [Candidatus Dormibacteraeota bacterium]